MREQPHLSIASCALVAVFSACQSSPLGTGDLGALDMLGSDSGSDSFASDVAAANASCSTGNCVVALPSIAVADGAAIRVEVAAFVAKWTATSSGNLDATTSACGTPNHADCATQLQHDLFKGDGCRGAAISPVANQVVATSKDVELVVWTPVVDGISQQPFVTLAGRRDGHLIGLAFAYGRACPAQ